MARYDPELTTAIGAALQAGDAIRDLYDRAAAATYVKADGSPVTDADLASDRIIREHIGRAFPDDAILTEEGADDLARLAERRVWVVDPIDGTAQFVARTCEFDVLIALVVDGRPQVGVMLQPVTGRYLAAVAGEGAWVGNRIGRERLVLAPVADGRAPRIMTSTWFGAPATLPALTTMATRIGAPPPTVTSLGIYARHLVPPDNAWDAIIGLTSTSGQTMAWEWDFAAADVVINEAGGRFTDLRGQLHRYNKATPRNTGGVLLTVDPRTHGRILDAVSDFVPVAGA